MSTSNNNMNYVNYETLNDIQDLQTIESDLFSTLESGIADGTLTKDQQDTIIKQIEQVSSMRIKLYENLNEMHTFYQENVSSSMDTLSEQSLAIGIVEEELKEAKKRLQIIKDEKINKQRLVEVNSYYGERYADYTSLMQLVVVACIPIIILSILANAGFIPQIIYSVLVIIIGVVAIIYLFYKLVYLNSHDNMDYQEYKWNFDQSHIPTVDTSLPNGKSDPWIKAGITCIGQDCCYPGTTYDISMNQCIPGTFTGKGYDTNKLIVLPKSSSKTA